MIQVHLFPERSISSRDWPKCSIESLCPLFYPICQLNHFTLTNGGFSSALTGVPVKELDFPAYQGAEIVCFLPTHCTEFRTWIADSLRDRLPAYYSKIDLSCLPILRVHELCIIRSVSVSISSSYPRKAQKVYPQSTPKYNTGH